MSQEPPILYAWLIRAPDLSTPLLNFTDKSARLVFVRFEDALLARDSALALAEQGGYPVDLVMFRAGQPFLSIDPSEWTAEPAAEEPTA